PKSIGEPLIEDWISDSEDENETEFKSKQRKHSFDKTKFVKSNEHVKTSKESVKKVENKRQAKYLRKNSQSPRGRIDTIVGPKVVVSNIKENEANAVKASTCWVWRPKQKRRQGLMVAVISREPDSLTFVQGNPQLELQEKGVIDSGCLRNMIRNKSYLSDYEKIDG
ncbi:hypothetical protein Tco_1136987, partial [Tanacetum coccineum]